MVSHQKFPQGLVVGDDAIVDDHKLLACIRHMWMAIDCIWRTMRRPAGVCNAGVTFPDLRTHRTTTIQESD